MPLSWNEIKTQALLFTKEWKDEVSEDAEAKSFWDTMPLVLVKAHQALDKAADLCYRPQPLHQRNQANRVFV